MWRFWILNHSDNQNLNSFDVAVFLGTNPRYGYVALPCMVLVQILNGAIQIAAVGVLPIRSSHLLRIGVHIGATTTAKT